MKAENRPASPPMMKRWMLSGLAMMGIRESELRLYHFGRYHSDDYEPGFEEVFVKLVDRLDPPIAT
jgi:hypothetical protein